MGEQLYVNEDWSKLVPAGSPEAAFGISEKDAKRRGLLKLADGEQIEVQEVMHSAPPLGALPEGVADSDELEAAPSEAAGEAAPEPEAKEAEKPADKAMAKPANKGGAKPASKSGAKAKAK